MYFEQKNKPLLPFRAFLKRALYFLFYSILLLAISLGIGVWGYYVIADLSLIDAFFNASMILTGMGPANPMETDAAKIFASLYALYSSIAFLTTVAVLFAPLIHRFLHKLHISDTDTE